MSFSSDSVEVFLAVIDHGSFSAAARALRRVPSAVSMAVAQLEAELDLQLFERSSRHARPTDTARALEAEARQMAGQLRRLQAHALSLHRGLEQRLTLAIAPEAARLHRVRYEALGARGGDAHGAEHGTVLVRRLCPRRRRGGQHEGEEEIAGHRAVRFQYAAGVRHGLREHGGGRQQYRQCGGARFDFHVIHLAHYSRFFTPPLRDTIFELPFTYTAPAGATGARGSNERRRTDRTWAGRRRRTPSRNPTP
eukprot:gene26928-30447_t